MDDSFALNRFLDAQKGVIDTVRDELASGRKRSHWMWFIFPQLAGLGHSPMARLYAIRSQAEALAFLHHATLGARLVDCTELTLAIETQSVTQIFGTPDDMKFHSSMTLFSCLPNAPSCFKQALAKFFGAEPDQATLCLLDS